MSNIKVASDNNVKVKIYYKDWGAGEPIIFSHGWPLSADAFEDQMFFLANKGYRCIAHDRRGHGRSSQPWNGNNMDTFADDLNALITALDLKNVVLVAHSMGGGEIARYVGRHGTERLKKMVFISSVPPLLLKGPNNPDGVPLKVFDDMREQIQTDRAQFFKDFSASFYGANRLGNKLTSKVSEGLRESFWRQGMTASLKSVYECVKAFSETHFTADLQKINIPTLIIHGDDDQTVPIKVTAEKAVKIIPHAELKIYKGAPHGLCSTHKNEVNQDLLNFLKK